MIALERAGETRHGSLVGLDRVQTAQQTFKTPLEPIR
jgi:hypothetical protein